MNTRLCKDSKTGMCRSRSPRLEKPYNCFADFIIFQEGTFTLWPSRPQWAPCERIISHTTEQWPKFCTRSGLGLDKTTWPFAGVERGKNGTAPHPRTEPRRVRRVEPKSCREVLKPRGVARTWGGGVCDDCETVPGEQRRPATSFDFLVWRDEWFDPNRFGAFRANVRGIGRV